MSAERQVIEFFLKRADYSSNLAKQHCQGYEFDKGVTLFKQAYAFLLKAQKELPNDEEVKTKIANVKSLYQDAKKKLDEKA